MSTTCFFVLVLIINNVLCISVNQPNICSCAIWNTIATTIANKFSVGQYPVGISINIHNNIYVSDRENNRILLWYNESWTPIIVDNLNNSWSIFITDKNEIFVDNGYSNGRVDKWALNGTYHEPVMYVNSSCTGLFVDIINNIYCSSTNQNRVFKKLGLNINPTTLMTVAGTGCPGPIPNMLDHPHGIFVDEKFNLYVADTDNNRIQRFKTGQMNAITVAGFGASIRFILNRPTSVILDGNNYMFIADSQNHRIIRSVSNGFQCLFGCSGRNGASSSQLRFPQTIAFDNDGNIFVTDYNNHRIQKFNLIEKSCNTTKVVPGGAETLWYMCNPFSPQTTYTKVSLYYTAKSATQILIFDVINVPSYTYLDDISVLDVTTSKELLCNGNFETGTCSPCWSGTGCSEHISKDNPYNGNHSIYNGATSMTSMQQIFNATVGRQLLISFWTKWRGSRSTGIVTSVSIQP